MLTREAFTALDAELKRISRNSAALGFQSPSLQQSNELHLINSRGNYVAKVPETTSVEIMSQIVFVHEQAYISGTLAGEENQRRRFRELLGIED